MIGKGIAALLIIISLFCLFIFLGLASRSHLNLAANAVLAAACVVIGDLAISMLV